MSAAHTTSAFVVEGPAGRLAGTREHAPRPTALAVLLAGSGPVDRDGNTRGLNLTIQRELATALAAAGVDSVRFDKRGVGESAGEFLSTGFDDLVDDALAVVDAVSDEGLPVVVIGHSEGSALAVRVAAQRPALAGIVMLSGYARSGLEVLRWQSETVAGDLPWLVRAVLRLMRTDVQKRSERARQQLLSTTDDVTRIGGARVNARWFREFMRYDPRDELARVRQPVLAVTGSYDLQSPPADLEVIAQTAGGPVHTVELPEVSHILRTQERATLRSYRADVRRAIDERVVRLISAWVAEVLSDRGSGAVDRAD